MMLNLLPPMIPATSPDQTAVIIPVIGLAPAAIAKERERGIETIATEMPDFQFILK